MPSLSDPIGDLLTRIRNAQAARRETCIAPLSRIKRELCELLVREGFLQSVEVEGDAPKQTLVLTFVPGKILTLKRESKPSRRVYRQSSALLPVLRGYGMAILTTSEGLLTDREARKRHCGGELLCTIS